MELFASFLRGLATQEDFQFASKLGAFEGEVPDALAELMDREENFVKQIANQLVDHRICDELWEGYIPVLSVILAHGLLSKFDASDDDARMNWPGNETTT